MEGAPSGLGFFSCWGKLKFVIKCLGSLEGLFKIYRPVAVQFGYSFWARWIANCPPNFLLPFYSWVNVLFFDRNYIAFILFSFPLEINFIYYVWFSVNFICAQKVVASIYSWMRTSVVLAKFPQQIYKISFEFVGFYTRYYYWQLRTKSIGYTLKH